MGMRHYYFTAEDDAAAIAAFHASGLFDPPFVLLEEIGPADLADLEHVLTGRSIDEITADARFCSQIAVAHLEEDPNVEEFGLLTVTDTVTRALAEADLAALPAWYRDVSEPVRELAAVARHAVTHGHHLYGMWLEDGFALVVQYRGVPSFRTRSGIGHVELLQIRAISVIRWRRTSYAGRRYEADRLAQDTALLDAVAPHARVVYVSGNSYFGETGDGVKLDETMQRRPRRLRVNAPACRERLITR